MPDGEEVFVGTDPTDGGASSGTSGQSSGSSGTSGDPRPDTDGDGLYDDDEVDIYGTDPNHADSDRDGVPDGEEVFVGTDPGKAEGLNPAGITTFFQDVSSSTFVFLGGLLSSFLGLLGLRRGGSGTSWFG